MNCAETQELMLDLLYGELSESTAKEVREHLDDCPACREEFGRLARVRAALKLHRASNEPAKKGPSTQSPVKALAGLGAMRRPIRILIPLSAAAAVVAAIVIFSIVGPTTTVSAADKPVEITRTGVSLTILSSPPEGSPVRMQRGRMQEQLLSRTNSAGYIWTDGYGWQGLALVRDQRLVKNLNKGVTEVRFDDVPTIIRPDTVRLRGLDNPDGLKILEQNYQFDLASAEAVLQRYVDEPIVITAKDGRRVEGKLLSFDDANLVIMEKRAEQSESLPPSPVTINRRNVKTIGFAKLPEGLLAKPTLVWQLQNNADRQQQFEVAYMTAGITWSADYVLKLKIAKGEERRAKGDTARSPEIVDTADLVGYATVTNNSGATYKDAQLKLMAGDVNLIQDGIEEMGVVLNGVQAENRLRDDKGGFQEKSFFEYHLYTLGRPTTLKSAETKQIEMITSSGLKLTRTYLYDPNVHQTAVQVVSETKNTQANGLGIPLPKGTIRLYAPDPDGQQEFVSHAMIDHTPLNEKLRLPWGFAFDIACTSKMNTIQRSDTGYHVEGQYSLRNHKEYGVTVTAIVRVPPSTRKFTCNLPWHLREVGWIEVQVPLKAGAAEKVTFTYDYDTRSGGGLKEPVVRPERPQDGSRGRSEAEPPDSESERSSPEGATENSPPLITD